MLMPGLPDFQSPLLTDGLQILTPFAGVGTYVVLPESLEIAPRPDGHLDFLLEIFRHQNPLLSSDPYGMLNLRLQPHYPLDKALAAIRGLSPQATLSGALFDSGFVHFKTIVGQSLPADVLAPVALKWDGLSSARFLQHLSLNTALFLKAALQDKALTFIAQAEMEMSGVSPRFPLQIRFDPAKLLQNLLNLADDQRRVARDALVDYFHGHISNLEIVGDWQAQPLESLAQALTDRVRMRFGSFVSAPKDDARAYLALSAPDSIGSGSFTWDLSEPLPVQRPLVLSLQPLDAARALVKDQGIEAVVHEVTVPAILTGFLQVTIIVNVPVQRIGSFALGVTLYAPPQPPQRVQAISQSVEFQALDDTATLTLQFSPLEPQVYQVSTYVLIQGANGIEQRDSEAQPHQGNSLILDVDDFPVDFVSLAAELPLLTLAAIHGICSWKEAGATVQQAFTLTKELSALAIVLPHGTEGAIVDIQAVAKIDGQILKHGPFPASGLRLGLYSFPEYGPHEITIACTLPDTMTLFALDLLSESRQDTPETLTVLSFIATQPTKTWTWLATSPFHAGYRFRAHRNSDQPPAAWSELQSPFENLTVSALVLSGGNT